MKSPQFNIMSKIINHFYARPGIIRILFPPLSHDTMAVVTLICDKTVSLEDRRLLRDEVLGLSTGVSVSIRIQDNLKTLDDIEDLDTVIAFYHLLGKYVFSVKKLYSHLEGYHGMTWTEALTELYNFIDFIQLAEMLETEKAAGNRPSLVPHQETIRAAWGYISSASTSVVNYYGLQIMAAELEPRQVFANSKEFEKITNHKWEVDHTYGCCYSTYLLEILNELKPLAELLF